MRKIYLLAAILLPIISFSQHLLKNKLEGCALSQFCLDCGKPRANVNTEEFRALIGRLYDDRMLNLHDKRFAFQILIDTMAKGCAISYDGNITANQATMIAAKLSSFSGWTPAVKDGQPENVSIMVMFDFSGTPQAGIQRYDYEANNENMSSRGTPEIKNTRYKYKNKKLKDYEFTIWTKENSSIPYDMSRAITVDKRDVTWHGTDNGLFRVFNDKTQAYDKTNPVFKSTYKFMSVGAAATDTGNIKYFDVYDKIYTYDGRKWEVLDSSKIGIEGAIDIVAAPNGKVFFCSFDGLLTKEGDKWNLWNTSNSVLPSNTVPYANCDSKGRTWIGTYGGSVMLNKDGKPTMLNQIETPLKFLCITDMTEDRDGNIWFATFDHEKKATEKLVKLDASDNWSYYDVKNSGLPENRINKVITDRNEDILWLSVHNVGLVRFDKKDNWEVYTNKNSGVPSTYILDIEQDSKGNLWCATFAGLLRVSKKK